MPDPEIDGDLLYSAWVVQEDRVYRLYFQDHATGLLQATELNPRAVATLPKYLPMLKMRVVGSG